MLFFNRFWHFLLELCALLFEYLQYLRRVNSLTLYQLFVSVQIDLCIVRHHLWDLFEAYVFFSSIFGVITCNSDDPRQYHNLNKIKLADFWGKSMVHTGNYSLFLFLPFIAQNLCCSSVILCLWFAEKSPRSKARRFIKVKYWFNLYQ